MALFKDVHVSTQTYIIRSNLATIDLPKLFTDIKNSLVIDEQISGKITNAKYSSGTKKTSDKCNNFSNCIILTINFDKVINVKIFNNGVFHLTGCKKYSHAYDAIIKLWTIMDGTQDFFTSKKYGFTQNGFEAFIISAMRNIDFKLGFKIDREKLCNEIFTKTPYKVTPMISPGFMRVQISIPLDNINDMKVHRIYIKDTIVNDTILMHDIFWSLINETKKPLKNKKIAISIFQTGSVLMSGVDEMYQNYYYDWFIKFIQEIKSIIIVEPPKTITF